MLVLFKKKLNLIFISLCFAITASSWAKVPKGKKTGVSFDKALPEDISNENFPDRIESFDFPNANLEDLIKAISKLTGMNFILDSSLKTQKISIIAPSSITVAEAYKAFLSALSANKLSVVKSGAFWKIRKEEDIHKDNIEVYSGDYFPSTDQLITRIIKLKYIAAEDFRKSITYLLSQNNKVSSHEASNSLIISDYGAVIERIMKIVYELDVPGLEEDIYIVPVEHASSDELAVTLRELLSLGKTSITRAKRNVSRRSKSFSLSPKFKSQGAEVRLKISHIIPDARTNSLIVRADKRGIERVRDLVKKLDIEESTEKVWVYNVLYGTAEDVYNTLMGIKPAKRGDNNRRNSRFFVSPNNNRGNTQGKSSSSSLFGDEVNILADHNTNSLIISANSKYEYEKVLNVLKKIDVPRDQVFIQAIILEMIVGRGNNTEFNLAGALGSLIGTESLGKESSVFRSIGESAIAGFLSNSIGLSNLQQASFGPGLILGLPFIKLLESLKIEGFSNRESIREQYPEFDDMNEESKREILESAVRADTNNSLRQSLSTSFLPLVRLLRKSDNINVLSTPQITTLDNVTAFIEVGENAPVGISNTTAGAGISQQNIDREDITLKLEITPLINPESGTVQMEIKQKFDDFSERSSLAADLNRQAVSVVKRNIETQMVLHNGETAVLGGLLSDKKVTNHNKVPLLGDIPFVGWLFKGSDVKTEKRNLLVFITPTIISGMEQKEKTKEILDKKLEERIEFIEGYMKGKDPHKEILKDLVPRSQVAKKKYIETLETEEVEETSKKKRSSFFDRFKRKPKKPKTDRNKIENSYLEEEKVEEEDLDTEDLDRDKFETDDDWVIDESGNVENNQREETDSDFEEELEEADSDELETDPAESAPIESNQQQEYDSNDLEESLILEEPEDFLETPPSTLDTGQERESLDRENLEDENSIEEDLDSKDRDLEGLDISLDDEDSIVDSIDSLFIEENNLE